MNGIACGDGPPEVAVIHGLATDDVSRTRFAEPAFGNDALAVEDTVLLDEQAEAAIIAQGCAEAATGEPHPAGDSSHHVASCSMPRRDQRVSER